jgi:hypothetical protein
MTVSGTAAGAPRLRLRLRRDMIGKKATIHNGRVVAAVSLEHEKKLKSTRWGRCHNESISHGNT